MFMKTLNDYQNYLLSDTVINEIAATGKWSSHGSSIYEYFDEQDMLDCMADSRLRKVELKRYLKDKSKEIFDSIETESPKFLYRSVYTKSLNNLKDREYFGIYWSSNPLTAPCVEKREGELEARITIEYDDSIIDWQQTLRSRIDFLYGDREFEFQIKKGEVVEVKSIDILEAH